MTPEQWSDPDACLEYEGYRNEQGYGQFRINGSLRRVHRLVWEATYGPIPEGLIIRHHCDNPACYRLSHLAIGTQADNVSDMMLRSRHGKTGPKGERAHAAKLTEDDVREIRRLFDDGCDAPTIAEAFSVTPTNIRYIVKRQSWRHVQ